MLTFRTHTGEIVQGERLKNALKTVAERYRERAHKIYEEDLYAAHVKQERKDQNLRDDLARANRLVREGPGSVTDWQDVNTVLTGKCVALLP